MTLSVQAINDFKEIYKRNFDEQLLDSEAEQKAIGMLRLFKMIYSSAAQRDRKYGYPTRE